MADPRKHHIVPECLLKKFTNADGKLARLKFRQAYSHARSLFYPSQVAYVKDFYRMLDKTGTLDPLIVESTINTSYENNFNKYWESLENDSPLVSVTWKRRVSEIIIHFKTRNLFIRNGVFTGEGLEKLINNFKANYLNDLRNGLVDNDTQHLYEMFSNNPDKLEEIARAIFGEENAQFHHTNFMHQHEVSPQSNSKEKLIEMYLNGRWTIHKAIPGQHFILSDNVGMTFNAPEHKLPLNGAFDFYFPISSSRYLQIYYNGENLPGQAQRLLYYAEAGEEHVLSMNTTVINNAISELYGCDGRELELAREHLIKQ